MPTPHQPGTPPSRTRLTTAAIRWGLAYVVTLVACFVLA